MELFVYSYYFPRVLIKHIPLLSYTEHADGLVCRLVKAFPRPCLCKIESLQKLEVCRTQFTYVRMLGRGSFGEVWHALWHNELPVAVKNLLNNGNMETTRFLEEAQLMQRLSHPRIVRLLGVCTQPSTKPAFIVTELMELGSLKHFMQSMKHPSMTFRDLIKMMLQVSLPVVYLFVP